MMRAISVYVSLCVLALCLSFPLSARANEGCFPYQENLAVAKEHPNVQATRELSSEELGRVVEFVGLANDMSVKIDTGYLALMMDNSVRFVFGAGGQVCQMVAIPAPIVPKLIEAILGRAA